jgi:hypothetical protein
MTLGAGIVQPLSAERLASCPVSNIKFLSLRSSPQFNFRPRYQNYNVPVCRYNGMSVCLCGTAAANGPFVQPT